MELPEAVEFARTHRQSVLTTIRRNGRPQSSNVLHTVGEDGLIRVSITADRAKYFNVKRDPWAAVHISREDFFGYVVIEGEVTLSEIAAAARRRCGRGARSSYIARSAVSTRTGMSTAARWLPIVA